MPDEIEALKQSARRWKRAAIVSWIVLALVVTAAAMSVVLQYREATQAMEAAQKAAREAEEAVKRQLEAEQKLTEARRKHDMLLYFQAISRAQDQLKQDDLKKARDWLKEVPDK